MASRLEWSGLAEFRHELRALPEHLKEAAGEIVLTAAADAKREIQGVYPRVTGNLQKGVTMTVESRSGLGASAKVKSNAQHAHLFEKGTRLRRTNTGASRGVMPVAPTAQQMIPIVIRVRRRMTLALIQMVQAHGLTVTSS